MNKKAIKKILAFVRLLKAPAKMMPYIIALVIGIVRRITDEDVAALIDLKEQGFVCRKSEQIVGGCGSPAVCVCSNGSIAVAFACTRVKEKALVSSICLMRSADPKQIATAGKRFVITSPLQIGNVTLTQTPQGLLLGWRTRSNAYLHYPSRLEKPVFNTLKSNNTALTMLLSEKEKQGGMHYALIPDNGEEIKEAYEAPALFSQSAAVLSGGEVLWLGVKDGKALAYRTQDVCKGFSLVGNVPEIETGRTYSHACCAKLKNGRVLAVLCSSGELFASYSDDMGTRWTVPKPLDINGTAPSLAVREDGVVSLSFVEPDKKFAIRSSINKDGESEWCKVRLLVSSVGDNSRRPYTVAVGDSFCTVSRIRFCGEKESSVLYTGWKPLKEDYDPVLEAQLAKESKKKKRGRKNKDAVQ